MLTEVRTFQLRADVDEAEFLRADEWVQHRLSSCEGFVRRTTARAATGDGAWLDLTLWATAEHAGAAVVTEARVRLDAVVDPASVRVERFTSLD